MRRFKPNQYYGYFDYDLTSPTFYVLVIKPSNSTYKDWIGSKHVKLSDMLCIDDYIIGNCSFTVDWSKVQK